MSDEDSKKRKGFMANFCYKRKNLLNYLIDHVEELKNVRKK